MIDYFMCHIGEVASMIVIVSTVVGMIRWSHNKLHADIMQIRDDVKQAHSRIDAVGNRVDNLYNVMLMMLKEKNKG